MAAKDQNETKKIAVKNYILLIIIFSIGIGLTMYFCNWYHVYDDYQKQTPVIRGTLSEITKDELEHYLLETPTTTIYMCTSSATICRNYEKDLKKLVKKSSLQETLVYLNLSGIDQSIFIEEFNNKYPYKVKLTEYYPALVVFEDGKVTNILQGKEDEKLTIKKTKQFIEINKIGE